MIDAFSKNGNIAETLELMDLIQRDPRIFEIFKAAATAPNGYINIETVSKRWIMTTRQHVYDAADVLIWLGIAVVTLWALGKAMGWIS